MKYALFSVPAGTIYDLPQTIKEGEEGLVAQQPGRSVEAAAGFRFEGQAGQGHQAGAGGFE